MPRSWSHVVNLALLIGLIAYGLPGGGWMVAAGGMAATALLYATIWLIGRYPEHANAPNQEKYDALPRAAKQRVMAVMQRWVGWETAGILAVIASVQQLSRAGPSGGASETTILLVVFGFTVLSTAAVPFLIWRVQATVNTLYEQTQSSRSPSEH
ncbi:MAG: hypothetical protein GVY35_00400 [Bacteroidetes bacterium]|jgi:hypothetical protein|nr:hypothetical protein [Bacteroidota bacterium]